MKNEKYIVGGLVLLAILLISSQQSSGRSIQPKPYTAPELQQPALKGRGLPKIA